MANCRIFVATEKLFLVFPIGKAEKVEMRHSIDAWPHRGAARYRAMYRDEHSSLLRSASQLACIVGLMLVAGCIAPRSELAISNAARTFATASVSAIDRSGV